MQFYLSKGNATLAFYIHCRSTTYSCLKATIPSGLDDPLPLDLDALVSEELDKEEARDAKVFPNGARIGHLIKDVLSAFTSTLNDVLVIDKDDKPIRVLYKSERRWYATKVRTS